MDLGREGPLGTGRWLPRARGDGPHEKEGSGDFPWAPPRTRGWTGHQKLKGGKDYGSPAHAGMDLGMRQQIIPDIRLPRARGDGPGSGITKPERKKAPPRTRGWTDQDQIPLDGIVGSPAHAGMDLLAPSYRSTSNWLPRARGDGPLDKLLPIRDVVAPPRTRGWSMKATTVSYNRVSLCFTSQGCGPGEPVEGRTAAT